jgi:hypothetical protein
LQKAANEQEKRRRNGRFLAKKADIAA